MNKLNAFFTLLVVFLTAGWLYSQSIPVTGTGGIARGGGIVTDGLSATASVHLRDDNFNDYSGLLLEQQAASANGPRLTFAKAQSSATLVSFGDHLGHIFALGYDGIDYNLAAEILFQVDGTPGVDDMPGSILFRTTPDGSNTPLERLRIEAGGNVIIQQQLQVKGGSPSLNKVLTSDANGLATWTLPDGGGFTDAGATVILTNINDNVGIGTSSPNAKLDVGGVPGASVGGFPSGNLHITGQSASVNGNSVITGHNLFGGNKQLWYLGSASGSNDNITLINRQNGSLAFGTNSTTRMTVESGGDVGIGLTNPTEKLEANGNVKASTIIDTTIYAQLSSSVDQNPSDTNPVVITYNTQDAIAGLTHSTSVNAGEITIDTAGIYFCTPQPQVGKTSGATRVDFDMFLQVDRGSGFVDEANSNIKLAIKDQDVTDVIVSAFTIQLDVGDKIRMMQRVTDSSVGMGLKNTDAEVGPPTIPRTPSIIFTMYRVGGV